MPIYELYSKRKQRAELGEEAEVYQYTNLPARLRTQIRQILTSAIGRFYHYRGHEMQDVNCNNVAWRDIANILRREMGVDTLAEAATPYDEIMALIQSANTDDALSVIELCGRWIDRVMSKVKSYELDKFGASQKADEAIEELNYRFRDAGVGYEYASGEIIRIDSRFLHTEVVKVALTILRDPRFKGAEEEFLDAYGHYRKGDAKDAITGANRAFESTMKAICKLKGWSYDEKARASDLIKILKANRLFPDYLDAAFDQLLATLASGLPQVRNNAGGHGQGAAPRSTPDYVAAYTLHLAATNIVFLANAALDGATT